jgi:hypothetical protein
VCRAPTGQFVGSIWDSDRTRCGELPRRIHFALPTARSVGEASDKPRIGVDRNNRRPHFGKESGKTRPAGCRNCLACRRQEDAPTASEAVYRGSGSPGKAEDCWLGAELGKSRLVRSPARGYARETPLCLSSPGLACQSCIKRAASTVILGDLPDKERPVFAIDLCQICSTKFADSIYARAHDRRCYGLNGKKPKDRWNPIEGRWENTDDLRGRGR